MFSEYASRFLAQSQTRPSAGQDENNASSSRHNQPGFRFGPSNGFRSSLAGPYPQTSRFSFASRTPPTTAPLFASTADDFREDGDGDEHQRDVADFYALQSSRKAFRASHLTDSSEADDYADYSSHAADDRTSGSNSPARLQQAHHPASLSSPSKPSYQAVSQKGKERLVSVSLPDSDPSVTDEPAGQEHVSAVPLHSAPAYPEFHFESQRLKQSLVDEADDFSNDGESSRLYQRPPTAADLSPLPAIDEDDKEEEASTMAQPAKHDVFWATLFWIAFASLFATAFLIYLHTDQPGAKNPLGDTIYTILRQNYFLLAVDTLITIIVAALWLALLRSYLKPLAYLTILAVPIILFSFSIWPLIASFRSHSSPFEAQYRLMRVFAIVPFLAALTWIYITFQSRHSIQRSIQILQLACKLLSASPALVSAGITALCATVIWLWLWLTIFTRVFLQGHMARKLFIIDTTSWYLAVLFCFMLLWTQSIIASIQRATSAATVSQWYFYRTSDTTVSSRQVVTASFNHATGPLFGTICLSTLISLLVRIPLLVLPRRVIRISSLCLYTCVSAPLKSLTSPVVLTYAAIHSQPLAIAARGLSRLPLASNISTSFSTTNHDTHMLAAYNTTHMLLQATRQIMTLALGLGAWLSTSSSSVYSYVVGLGAATIAWSILGAVEGIIAGIVDGLVVCWGSEIAAGRQPRFCPEASLLFGTGQRRRTSQAMV